jgi:predicted metal-dependent enzyme (double-stranded beta helix superfamily)
VADYRLVDFIRDLSSLVDAEPPCVGSGRRLIDGTRALMEPLCACAGLIGTALERREGRGYSRNLLYHDPHDRFVVAALFWEPGHETPVHDHGTWGAMAVYKSLLEVVNYQRTDNGHRRGFATLEPVGTLREGTGSVSWVLPPDEEIHRVRNPTDRTALSLHVYGRDIRRCNIYDLASGRVGPIDLDYDNHV